MYLIDICMIHKWRGAAKGAREMHSEWNFETFVYPRSIHYVEILSEIGERNLEAATRTE